MRERESERENEREMEMEIFMPWSGMLEAVYSREALNAVCVCVCVIHSMDTCQ